MIAIPAGTLETGPSIGSNNRRDKCRTRFRAAHAMCLWGTSEQRVVPSDPLRTLSVTSGRQ